MTKQITPLRQRMIDDMALRNMSPATQRVYINAVKNFSAFFGRSPDKLTFEDVRTYRRRPGARWRAPPTDGQPQPRPIRRSVASSGAPRR